VLPFNDDERLVGIQPHQSILMISNIMFARFLILSILLEPWSHNIVPPSAQTKQSTANFKHIASLLLHVYNMALSSLTGIPVAQLRAAAAADGLLQATEEGFQVMLRYCEEEWTQQLKSGIESWLKFMIRSVSPGLLGLSIEAPRSQEQQAANQDAAADVLLVPEVRGLFAIRLLNACAYVCHCVIVSTLLHPNSQCTGIFSNSGIFYSPADSIHRCCPLVLLPLCLRAR
jgi:hypothetical protein